MTTRLTTLALTLAAATALITACGDDGGSAPATTAAPTTAAPTTAAPTTAAPTTAAPTTTVAGPQPLPATGAEHGTFRLDKFAVPFDLTVEGRWSRFDYQSQVLVLGRGSNAETEFVVRIGWADATTADEVLDAFCPASGGETANRRDTTMLGQPARQADISVTNDCVVFSYEGSELYLVPGHSGLLTATVVDGQVVVVLSDAPSAQWPDLADEVTRMVTSMTLL